MLAVTAPCNQVEPLLPLGATVACINGPCNVTVALNRMAVQAGALTGLEAELAALQIRTQRVQSAQTALHMTEDTHDDPEATAANLCFLESVRASLDRWLPGSPKLAVTWITTVPGSFAEFSPAFLLACLSRPVTFHSMLQHLPSGARVLEVGSQPMLHKLVQRVRPDLALPVCIDLVQRPGLHWCTRLLYAGVLPSVRTHVQSVALSTTAQNRQLRLGNDTDLLAAPNVSVDSVEQPAFLSALLQLWRCQCIASLTHAAAPSLSTPRLQLQLSVTVYLAPYAERHTTQRLILAPGAKLAAGGLVLLPASGAVVGYTTVDVSSVAATALAPRISAELAEVSLADASALRLQSTFLIQHGLPGQLSTFALHPTHN
ncbi:uncharacterized protein MONBRDRAFT_9427 [Monosiga brevicollis MX1]|uniref:Uncharacterized protein n=1 Tax=Monosiga brevicollis TaxID=81824 RepID=A9V339_MONBE|nr:uncharacterized protein MONBRDRAFT_9427 [Monosiga brevicollis MX1]EDQ88121.1 predicted protein [Monosiga brevicollis MX1]|eukprot:XP_001747197.1 hypothetical protein [Monosiga brevicollis MX1]